MKEFEILLFVIIVSLIISAPLVSALSWTGKFWEFLNNLFKSEEKTFIGCTCGGYQCLSKCDNLGYDGYESEPDENICPTDDPGCDGCSGCVACYCTGEANPTTTPSTTTSCEAKGYKCVTRGQCISPNIPHSLWCGAGKQCCEIKEETCLSQGYHCCSTGCTSGHHSEYDDSCGEGYQCCETCKSPTTTPPTTEQPTTTPPTTTPKKCDNGKGFCIANCINCEGTCEEYVGKDYEKESCDYSNDCTITKPYCCKCKESTPPTTTPPDTKPKCEENQCLFNNKCYKKGETTTFDNYKYIQYICDGNKMQSCNEECKNTKIDIEFLRERGRVNTKHYICCDLGEEKGAEKYQWIEGTKCPTIQRCYDDKKYEIDVDDNGVPIGTKKCGKYGLYECKRLEGDEFTRGWWDIVSYCKNCENDKCKWQCSDCDYKQKCTEDVCKGIAKNVDGGCYFLNSKCYSCSQYSECNEVECNEVGAASLCEAISNCPFGPCEWNINTYSCDKDTSSDNNPKTIVPENPSSGEMAGFVIEGCEKCLNILINQENNVLDTPIISSDKGILFIPQKSGKIKYLSLCFDKDVPQVKKGIIDVPT